jgi:NitT/TauT family transport system substrate-binding protein
MFTGEVDLALSTEYAVAAVALRAAPLSIIGNLDKFQSFVLIGRKDRGIHTHADLKGKAIGVASETIGEFYLGRFLDLHGIGLREVTFVNTPLAESQDALIAGRVDAVMMMRHDISEALQARLAQDYVVWPGQNSQAIFSVLTAQNAWIVNHSDAVRRFLHALAQAEVFTSAHPARARGIIQAQFAYSDAYMTTMWLAHNFALTLDQSLIVALEDEGRWLIANRHTNATQIPDFGKYIFTTGLKAVKPDAMNIIH